MVVVENGVVTMSEEEYDSLVNDSIFLSCLRNSGVDNWDWYDEAVNDFNKIIEGEDE